MSKPIKMVVILNDTEVPVGRCHPGQARILRKEGLADWKGGVLVLRERFPPQPSPRGFIPGEVLVYVAKHFGFDDINRIVREETKEIREDLYESFEYTPPILVDCTTLEEWCTCLKGHQAKGLTTELFQLLVNVDWVRTVDYHVVELNTTYSMTTNYLSIAPSRELEVLELPAETTDKFEKGALDVRKRILGNAIDPKYRDARQNLDAALESFGVADHRTLSDLLWATSGIQSYPKEVIGSWSARNVRDTDMKYVLDTDMWCKDGNWNLHEDDDPESAPEG